MSIDIKGQMKEADIHVVVNGQSQRATVYNRKGEALWAFDARCYGQHNDWRKTNGDTPPGLYRVGQIYDTTGEAAYGYWCLDLIDLENQETGNGRAGISLHGGGSGLPRPFAPVQGWQSTHGCIRAQNQDVQRFVSQVRSVRANGGQAYLTVVYPKGYLT